MEYRKAQSSVEFMLIFMLLLLVLALAAWISGTKTTEINTIEKNLEIGRVLDDMKNTIDTVYIEGNGFSTQLEMPYKIYDLNYTMMIYRNQVLIDVEGFTYSKVIMTYNVTGNFSYGKNYLKNENGFVVIES